MTAADQIVRSVKKVLAIGGRPHMTTGVFEPLDAAARHDLLEILEERYGRRATIITSQIPVDQWHDVIGNPTYADAILDRLVHNAHRINLAGHSLRRDRTAKD